MEPGSTNYGNYIEKLGGFFTNRSDDASTILKGYKQGNSYCRHQSADGSATFTNNVEVARLVVDGSKATIGDYYTVIQDTSGDIIGGWTNADGSFKVGGTLPSAPNIELNQDGSATFTGATSTANGTILFYR